MRPIRNLTLLLLLAAVPAMAQQSRPAPASSRPATPVAQPAATSLKQVRDAHAAADADRSGGLSSSEAIAAGVEATAFVGADADGDLQLGVDEFVVWSEGRAAKQAGGSAPDLTAESTRLQALRRAQKSEELKNQREAKQAPEAPAPGSARTAGTREKTPATDTQAPAGEAAASPATGVGPAAARRAVAPETAAQREQRLRELREGIARRLRNGELTPEKAQEAYAALDRRIGNALGEEPKSAALADPQAAEAKKQADLVAIEESLNRRLRNSELDPAKALEVHGDVSKRIDNAQGGATPPAAPAPAAGINPATAAPSAPETFRGRVLDAQGDLTRRLRNAELTPEQAAAEREALRLRIQRAAEQRQGVETAPAPARPETTPAAPASVPTVEPARPSRARSDVAPTTPPATRRTASDPVPASQPAPSGARPASTTPTPPANQPAPARPASTDKPASGPAPARPAPQVPPAPKPVPPPTDGGNRGN